MFPGMTNFIREKARAEQMAVVYPNMPQSQRDARAACSCYWEGNGGSDEVVGRFIQALWRTDLSYEDLEELHHWIGGVELQNEAQAKKAERAYYAVGRMLERAKERESLAQG
jgi:hypothetical protein